MPRETNEEQPVNMDTDKNKDEEHVNRTQEKIKKKNGLKSKEPSVEDFTRLLMVYM